MWRADEKGDRETMVRARLRILDKAKKSKGKQSRTLAHVLALDSISELDGLVDTGGSSRGNGGPELAALLRNQTRIHIKRCSEERQSRDRDRRGKRGQGRDERGREGERELVISGVQLKDSVCVGGRGRGQAKNKEAGRTV